MAGRNGVGGVGDSSFYVRECSFIQSVTLSNLSDAGRGGDGACLLTTAPQECNEVPNTLLNE